MPLVHPPPPSYAPDHHPPAIPWKIQFFLAVYHTDREYNVDVNMCEMTKALNIVKIFIILTVYSH